MVKQKFLNILLIDNYDSYTFNLHHLLLQCGDPVLAQFGLSLNICTVQQDALYDAASSLTFDLDLVDAIVLSPGPGKVPEDIGQLDRFLTSHLKQLANIPILGVCLGHQILAYLLPLVACGPESCPVSSQSMQNSIIKLAQRPVHGESFKIRILDSSCRLFASIDDDCIGFDAIRYHSYIVDISSFDHLVIQSAFCTEDDGSISCMALEYRSNPWFGLQFHPESIGTMAGAQIILNFLSRVVIPLNRTSLTPLTSNANTVIPMPLSPFPSTPSKQQSQYIVFEKYEKRLPLNGINVEELFARCVYEESIDSSFWLDSSINEANRARYSYMGNDASIGSCLLSYNVVAKKLCIKDPGTSREAELAFTDGLHSFLKRLLDKFKESSTDCTIPFSNGLIGFFGYEMKYETLPLLSTKALNHNDDDIDAAFLLTMSCISIDNCNQTLLLTHLYFRYNQDFEILPNFRVMLPDLHAAQEWVESKASAILSLNRGLEIIKRHGSLPKFVDDEILRCVDKVANEGYSAKARKCQDFMKLGLSYELCLTAQIKVPVPRAKLSPKNILDLYIQLRGNNPATYASFLNFRSLDLSILSSSPECFVKVRNGSMVSMKPIKGTVKRESMEPISERDRAELLSVKNRSENIMIVDLIRHDLSGICHDVTVPKLFAIESYETVHQLVSTVTGTLNPQYSIMDIVKTTFPPGSMTGAPKVKSVQLLHDLEDRERRGIYSGILGFMSLDQRSCEFSVVIRTIVLDGKRECASVGAGGAVVMLSDPDEEETEMRLKANSVLPTLSSWLLSPGQ